MVQQLETSTNHKPSQGALTKEFELPDTVFVRDIENRVFQAIILQRLSKIEGISLLEGTFFDNILGRESVKGIKGINAEQDSKNHSVNVRVEVSILYGIPIPDKAEEIQAMIAEDITSLTGLHVASVHVVFKNVILPADLENPDNPQKQEEAEPPKLLDDSLDEEF